MKGESLACCMSVREISGWNLIKSALKDCIEMIVWRQLKKINNSGAVDGEICKINAVTLRYDIAKNPISRSVFRSKSQTVEI